MSNSPRSDHSAGDFFVQAGHIADQPVDKQPAEKKPDHHALAVERALMRFFTCPSEHFSVAAKAAVYHLESGGGRFRARLGLHAGRALKLPDSTTINLAAAVELLHNASLIHDDLQDQDRDRRGRAAVWQRYSADIAICAGDLMLSAAYASLASCQAHAPQLVTLMHQRTAELIRGQCADLGSGSIKGLAVADYERIAADKSGPLLSLPLEFALSCAQLAGHDFLQLISVARRCGTAFAVGYQIFDDLGDVERDRTTSSLNLVEVYASLGHEDAFTRAQSRALQWFSQATDLAAALPDCMADPIIEAAGRLSNATRSMVPA